MSSPSSEPESSIDTFEGLFTRFVESYLASESGRAHGQSYKDGREQGRKHFERVVADAGAGQDVTDAVLLKLLPHADTTGNRERGAWICVAPAVTKDLKTWFEGAGWAKPHDWPAIAQSILTFIRRCNDRPEDLSQACADFSGSTYSKGLQTGMLSPILNALRPDDFLIINNKSRRVINHFSDQKFRADLMDYPAANATVHRFVAENHAFLEQAVGGDIVLADALDMFSHWLVAIEKYNFGKVRCWKIAPGKDAWNWETCRDEGFIAVGWDELGDLGGVSDSEFTERSSKFVDKINGWTVKGSRQAWRFANRILPGDRIIANRGTTEILGIGTVTGDYYFVPDTKHGHRLPVDWDDVTHRQVKENGWKRTLVRIISPQKVKELFEAPPVGEGTPPPTIPPVPVENDEYSLDDMIDDTCMPREVLEAWVRSLRTKKQVVLYGPPGTGKTFLAERLARHLISGADGFRELVQFHPAYAYEDFIQGIRPRANKGGSLDYPVVPGRFLEFCSKAEKRGGTCVLIIDEINRANLARVFGELMYLLEYRDHSAPLSAGGVLRVPQNVHLIGTMNTADRSIALVDHALRRRFRFLQLAPNYTVLEQFHERNKTGFPAGKLTAVLQHLNNQIDDGHYEIGISFFLHTDLSAQLPDIWQTEIEPYLEEYFFDQPAKVDEFRWDKVSPKVLS